MGDIIPAVFDKTQNNQTLTKTSLKVSKTSDRTTYFSALDTPISKDYVNSLTPDIDILEQYIWGTNKPLLKTLLQDKTTRQNIYWACQEYIKYGNRYAPDQQIFPELITGTQTKIIQPRIAKSKNEQVARTKRTAEVFTPSWICNEMNNLCDEDWFGRKNVFNVPNEKEWISTIEPISFPKNKNWKEYIDSKRLEITCGEAPFLASRYDTTTGTFLPVSNRIGILDRKLRIVCENNHNEADWFKWAKRAFEATYGYEYQGDNLLIARENLLYTFIDFYIYKFEKLPDIQKAKEIADIIAWNLWQMDGLKNKTPFSIEENDNQLDLFNNAPQNSINTHCQIKDWRCKKTLNFHSLKGENTMKFAYVIGNPPYQDPYKNTKGSGANSVYDKFLDSAFDISDNVFMIHPARFLFNAGSTTESWNKKMLEDTHFQIVRYEANSSVFFPSLKTPIKGGIVISKRIKSKDFGSIGFFSEFSDLQNIVNKVTSKQISSISSIAVTSYAYRFTEKSHIDFPQMVECMSSGHSYDLTSNCFDRVSFLFFDEKPNHPDNFIKLLGRFNNKRVFKYIKREYINDVTNFNSYKIFIPKANGDGSFGETISEPILAGPQIGSTETFMSIGCFDNKEQTENLMKYIKTKFARTLLGAVKRTQDMSPSKWKYVPLQDFTDKSDIDWSKSIPDIDKQLYQKYGLTQEEIDFIENKVKPME